MRKRTRCVQVGPLVDADAEALYQFASKPAADQCHYRSCESYDKGKCGRAVGSVVAAAIWLRQAAGFINERSSLNPSSCAPKAGVAA